MKIVPIFVSASCEDGLWSIKLDDRLENEFENFFERIHDIEWLHEFFDRNKADLRGGFFGNITMQMAVSRTLDEAEVMEDLLYEYAERGFEDSDSNLQFLFKPLNNYEYVIAAHQKSKARIRKGWLRLYALRLAKNCYLVTGGAIKLTLDMEKTHLQFELEKLEQAKRFLNEQGIDYPEDLNNYKDE